MERRNIETGQEPEFRSGQQFDIGIPRPRRVDDFTLAPNGKLIIKGESRVRSEPIKGTGKIRRVTNQTNRRR